MSATVRVLVVDDHPVFREGFAALLRSLDDVEVVGTAGQGLEALELVDRLGADRVDVVVMDVQMPVLDGLQATRRLLARHPQLAVVVLTMAEDVGLLLEAVRAGARGYLLKGAEPGEVSQAVRSAAHGGVVFGAALARAVTEVLGTASAPPDPRDPFPVLTPRERQVLDLVAAGLTNDRIAQRLGLSSKTVRNQVSAVLTKLQAPSRGDAIVRAREAGLGRGRPGPAPGGRTPPTPAGTAHRVGDPRT